MWMRIYRGIRVPAAWRSLMVADRLNANFAEYQVHGSQKRPIFVISFIVSCSSLKSQNFSMLVLCCLCIWFVYMSIERNIRILGNQALLKPGSLRMETNVRMVMEHNCYIATAHVTYTLKCIFANSFSNP